jgi:flavin reductase (DIM6/NTAB) family NADH-FMN oxidoreductase RutF
MNTQRVGPIRGSVSERTNSGKIFRRHRRQYNPFNTRSEGGVSLIYRLIAEFGGVQMTVSIDPAHTQTFQVTNRDLMLARRFSLHRGRNEYIEVKIVLYIDILAVENDAMRTARDDLSRNSLMSVLPTHASAASQLSDEKAFRQALGSFTTGVTVVTTGDREGRLTGVTANSFNSVSLSPPLVLWSISKTSKSWEVFEHAPYWAVHILAQNQEELANLFARRSANKFAGLAFDISEHDIPLLSGCSARMECRNTYQYEGGDHVIMVGEVIRFEHADLAPLVYQRGGYAFATRKIPSRTAEAVRPPESLSSLLAHVAHDLTALTAQEEQALMMQLGDDAATLRQLLKRVEELSKR